MLNKEKPAVSVLMTVYNRENYISEAIESVLASEYRDWELIICDDGSSDASFEIASGYANRDPRIRLFKNEKNLGDYPNRNNAASHACGEYIVIVDSDDWMLPGPLSKWVALMEEHKANFGIFSHSQYTEPVLLDPGPVIHRHFFIEPVLNFGPIATIVRNAYFKSINGFPEKYGPANDMYYNLKAASRAATLIFPFPLVNYRIHDGQEFNNKYSYLYNNYRYLRDALNELDLPLSSKEKKYLNHKNKRRFVVNLMRYFAKTRDLKKTRAALGLSGFKWKDLPDAVINRSVPGKN